MPLPGVTPNQPSTCSSDFLHWVDPYPPGALHALITALPASNVFALIDRAFDKNLSKDLKRRFPHLVQQSLFKDRYNGPGLESLSPCLLRVPEDSQERLELFIQLMRATSGKPMLSFLAAEKISVLGHLRDQLEAKDSQGKGFLLRLADTRALDLLLKTLTPSQRQRLICDGLQWWYWRRDGELCYVQGNAETDADRAKTKPYQFDNKQIQQMAKDARADGLLFSLRKNPELFGVLSGRPSVAHRYVQEVLDSGDSEQMHDAVVFRLMLESLCRNGLLT